MAETIHVIGQGGVVFEVDAGLEYVQGQLRDGLLQVAPAPAAPKAPAKKAVEKEA